MPHTYPRAALLVALALVTLIWIGGVPAPDLGVAR